MVTGVVVRSEAGAVYVTEAPVVALSVPSGVPTNDQFKVPGAGALEMTAASVVAWPMGNTTGVGTVDVIAAIEIDGDRVTRTEAEPAAGEFCTLVAVTSTVQAAGWLKAAGTVNTAPEKAALVIVPDGQLPPVGVALLLALQVTPGVVALDTWEANVNVLEIVPPAGLVG
jgi:hypothetical protein